MSTLTSILSRAPFSMFSLDGRAPKTGRVDGPVRLVREDPDATLAQRLRSETAQAHRRVESTRFVKGILRGVMDIESFITMQAGLYMIYEVMERELERHRNHPLVGQFVFPELLRTAVLEKDLETLAGPEWRQQLKNTPAREAYIGRIEWLSENEPELLVAHHYTRYLGDLSGGQAVAKIVRRALGLTQD